MMSFKFIHAADLHLDSPFRTIDLEDEVLANRFKMATFDAFKKIVDECIDQEVDFFALREGRIAYRPHFTPKKAL